MLTAEEFQIYRSFCLGYQCCVHKEKGCNLQPDFRMTHFQGNWSLDGRKISIGKSLYGALTYSCDKINRKKGVLLTTNSIFRYQW